MKRIAIILGCALAVAGCTMASDEDRMENAIREELTKNGEVKQVEMTRAGDDRMTGFAEIRTRDGTEGRLNCTATRDATKGSNYYDWRCLPAIDQRVVDGMETTIRQELSRQAEVVELEMTRQDDSRMTGHALLRDAGGNEVRTNCTATRENEASAQFNWRCQPGDAAEAPAGGGGEEAEGK